METSIVSTEDTATAAAFASSWNNLPSGSVYTEEQVRDWFSPLEPQAIRGKRVLEMGCGNGSLLVHVLRWMPGYIEGIDLGASVRSAEANARAVKPNGWKIVQADLVKYRGNSFDLVYSIGVLHHLKKPFEGFQAVLSNVAPGGRFHCWVYGKEGNLIVRLLVEPIRRIASNLPWWVTKYGIATPLAIPFYLYGLLFKFTGEAAFQEKLPLGLYMRWISKREFSFFRHVAFDQLVTPQTVYIDRGTLETWLSSDSRIKDPYIISRNGNSWKFGGRIEG